MDGVTVGAMLRRELQPEQLRDAATALEAAGYDQLWVVEDCFYAGGIATAATVLAVTGRVGVGIGILPAVARHAAFTAMELAALARLAPGRLTAGIGHGVGAWMQQVGAMPPSQLAALEETLETVRALLAGGRVTRHGRHVDIDDVVLDLPPAAPPPVLAGVLRPRSLEVATRAADGVILPEGSPPAFVADVRRRLGPGARLVVYAWAAPGEDAETLRAPVEEGLADPRDVRRDFLDAADPLAHVTVAGDAAACRAAIGALAGAGADTVVLVPHPDRPRALETAPVPG